MREVCAFRKTKSAISSLSLSSEDNDIENGGYEEEKKSEPSLPIQKLNSQSGQRTTQNTATAPWNTTRKPAPEKPTNIDQYGDFGLDSTKNKLRNATTQKRNTSSITPRALGQYPQQRALPNNVQSRSYFPALAKESSKTCEGKLMARILPKKHAEYDTRKPTQTNAALFIKALSLWQSKNNTNPTYSKHGDDVRNGVPEQSRHCCQETIEQPPSDDEESVVILDLYLLRSAFLDQLQLVDELGNYTVNMDSSHHREHNIHSLMSAVDLTRNYNFGSKPNSREKIKDKTTDLPSSCHTSQNGDITPRKGNTSKNIFHIHMNRPSTEQAARTLRRLELSTTRKLQTLHPFKGCGKRHQQKNGKDDNLARIHKLSGSKLVLKNGGPLMDRETGKEDNELDSCHEDDDTGYTEVDMSGWNSADMWRMSANSNNGALDSEKATNENRWGVELIIPNIILPWPDNDDASNQDSKNLVRSDDITNTNSSNYISSSSSVTSFPSSSPSTTSSPSPSVETVHLDIISNPPTILSIQTFENFTTHVFVGVPLVVETTVLYATHAIVTWYVNAEVARHDSNSYTPTEDDVGKRISILVTPIRRGHDGEGCQEAYSFDNLVEGLPNMPIVELRDKWSRGRCCNMTDNVGGIAVNEINGSDGQCGRIWDDKRLRVVTVSQ